MSASLSQQEIVSAVEEIIDYLKQSGYDFNIDTVDLSDARKKISRIFMTTHAPNTYSYVKLITIISKCLENRYSQTVISKLKNEITRLREETIPAIKLKREVELTAKFNSELDILKSTTDYLKAENESLKQENESLKQENESLKEEIKTISTTSYEQLKHTIDELQEENEHLEAALEHYSEMCPTYD